jgi:hypothetical protein
MIAANGSILVLLDKTVEEVVGVLLLARLDGET